MISHDHRLTDREVYWFGHSTSSSCEPAANLQRPPNTTHQLHWGVARARGGRSCARSYKG